MAPEVTQRGPQRPGLFGQIASLRRNFNRRLACMVTLLCISQFNFGFDVTSFSSIQAMDAFAKEFGDYDPKKDTYELSTTWVSLFNGLQNVGFIIGILIGSYISKRFGRRACIFAMCILALVWATICITSKNRWQILMGRTLNYTFMGMDLSVIPVMQAEITPAQNRGFTVGTYQLMTAGAQVIASAIARGTGDIQNNHAWQIPLALFYWAPTVVASVIWFLPESPRWLIMNDRREEALTNLTKLREGKYTEEEINVEFAAICDGIDAEARRERGHWKEVFQPGPNLNRTLIIIGCNCFLAGTGTNFANTYGALFIRGMDAVNPFTVTLSANVAVTIIVLITILVIDKCGRRWFPIVATGVQTLALFTMGALGTVEPATHAIKAGIISMMMILIAAYSGGWAPVVHMTSVELCSSRLRDYTYRTANICQILVQLITTLTIPYLLDEGYANLQSKVGFIFGVVAFAAFIFHIYCVPEVKGLSLEVIDRLFVEGVRYKDFQKVGRQYMIEMDGDDGDDEEAKKNNATVHVESVPPPVHRVNSIPAAEHGTMQA
ncbi:general substrate transporter [Xylariomycetidae sp. FL0641]|nr:general substrate transporter [Xylariomycetidae sp. FL0641]